MPYISFFKSETWWCYIDSKFTLVLLKIYFLYDVRLEIDEFPLSAMCNGNADEYKDLIDINIITQHYSINFLH